MNWVIAYMILAGLVGFGVFVFDMTRRRTRRMPWLSLRNRGGTGRPQPRRPR
jgi:hypothetical protein